jgi:sulfur carrier protein
MHILVNDQTIDCPPDCTMGQLLEQLGIPIAGTAVARNDTVVRKATYAETVLQPGDRLEIIRAVAGG